jgi:hypothetical protein
VEAQQLLALAVGAFFGALGWLVVGLYMQRRASEKVARSAARAVYFELSMNATDVAVAAEHGVYQPLRRAAFDRLLPDLATWLDVDELNTIVTAYVSQAGYEQAQRDERLPAAVREALLGSVISQHNSAKDLLRQRAFSSSEAARLAETRAAGQPAAETSARATSDG